MKLRTAFSKVSLMHLFVVLFLRLLIEPGLTLILEAFFPNFSQSGVADYIIGGYFSIPIIIAYLWIIMKSEGYSPYKLLKKDIKSIPLIKATKDILLVFFIHQVINCSSLIFQRYLYSNNRLVTIFQAYSPKGTITGFNMLTPIWLFAVFIIGPVAEEIIFRGWILNRLLVKRSTLFAIIVTTFLFAIAHGPLKIFQVFISTILYAIIYLKYQNIGIPIILHILNNIFSGAILRIMVILLPLDWSSYGSTGIGRERILLSVTIVLTLLCIGSVIYFAKKNWPSDDQVNFLETSLDES